MTKGYWIASITTKDAERYKDYISAARPIFEKHGAKPLVRGGAFEAPEGEARDRNVVLEFDSFEQAQACYNSSEYQEAAKIRQEASDGRLVIIKGVE